MYVQKLKAILQRTCSVTVQLPYCMHGQCKSRGHLRNRIVQLFYKTSADILVTRHLNSGQLKWGKAMKSWQQPMGSWVFIFLRCPQLWSSIARVWIITPQLRLYSAYHYAPIITVKGYHCIFSVSWFACHSLWIRGRPAVPQGDFRRRRQDSPPPNPEAPLRGFLEDSIGNWLVQVWCYHLYG